MWQDVWWKGLSVTLLSIVLVSFVIWSVVYNAIDASMNPRMNHVGKRTIKVSHCGGNKTLARKNYRFRKPMEQPSNVNYTDNIYFSVRTTESNYEERLMLLMMTWLQVVKHKLTIISDGSHDNIFVKTIKRTGIDIVVTNCFQRHKANNLCCKLGEEFAAYYRVREQHHNKEGYQWFCHFDDDVYVNIPQLSQLLQKYDPHQPHYIGRWREDNHFRPYFSVYDKGAKLRLKELHYIVKHKEYQFGSGAAYCISSAMMTEAEKYFNGIRVFQRTCQVTQRSDDVSVGYVLGGLLGYNLTSVADFNVQYDNLENYTLQEALQSITIGYTKEKIKQQGKCFSLITNHVPVEARFDDDPTRFLSYHCLLYPSVSWCKR
ncbi:beta-1,3-N-acetylglucosaminyltransferase radical fringe-like [Dysidea avara]|uniref:beta-1,3-N-acetylglucosaminyltransferase radical fringe-like n=1 Tax=Dysidea avara TaxID=196820 RepID=UPI0033349FBA